jgi:hypothetical protein
MPRTDVETEWSVPDPAAYCYLLGCYLGDGNIVHRPPNGWTLRIACDQRYPAIIDEVLLTIARTFAPRQPTRRPRSKSASEVLSISHPGIERAFPQHGGGPKHQRRIALVDRQLLLTHAHPKPFIRGLIHSDGCRTINSFRTPLPSGRTGEYAYVRYFSNLSGDIRAIFREHCELLGIRVTQPNHRNLAISHRASVAILDTSSDRRPNPLSPTRGGFVFNRLL